MLQYLAITLQVLLAELAGVCVLTAVLYGYWNFFNKSAK